MEIPCTHTSPTALISWSGRRNAGHRLSRRENCSGMHGAGMSPSPESFEEPAWIRVCFRRRTNVLGHRVEHFCALRLAMLSSRVQTSSSGYVNTPLTKIPMS